MANNGYREPVVHAGVDQAQEMPLAGCQDNLGILSARPVGVNIGAIEKDVGAGWRRSRGSRDEGVVRIIDTRKKVVRRAVVPVRDGEYAEINVVR